MWQQWRSETRERARSMARCGWAPSGNTAATEKAPGGGTKRCRANEDATMLGSKKRGSVTGKQHRDEEAAPRRHRKATTARGAPATSVGQDRGTERRLRGRKSKRKTLAPNKANGKMPLFPRAG